jgi:hypothetical protein
VPVQRPAEASRIDPKAHPIAISFLVMTDQIEFDNSFCMMGMMPIGNQSRYGSSL